MLAAAGSHLCYHVEPLSGMEDSTTENGLVLFEKMDRAVPEAGPVVKVPMSQWDHNFLPFEPEK